MNWWTRILDFISPRQCVMCGSRLSPTERSICSVCMLHLPRTGFQYNPTENIMAQAFWHLTPVERAAALFYFTPHSEVAQIVYELKYANRPDIGEDMGRLMATELQAARFFDGIDVLLPMPITRRRRWQRGYNQSHELARGISLVTGLPIADRVVKRVSFTQSQTTRHAWERLHGVDNAFRLVKPEAIANRHVLLIDDIVTTGATISSCARELAKAPGVRISILALGVTRS